VRRREMGRDGGNSAIQALFIPLGPIFLSLPVPEIAKTGLTLMADISWVYESFRTRMVAIERGGNKLSNAIIFFLNGSVVQKLRSFEVLFINFKYT